MITAGFLAGSLVAILDKENVQWCYFAAALGVGVTGIVFVRVGVHRISRSEGRLAANVQAVEASLGRIVENINQLNAQKHSINTCDMRHRIDGLFAEDLAAFVNKRESIAHVHGLSAYADVMSSFAAGERYLNRVWSASADGYIDEVNAYLDKAQAQFVESLAKIRDLAVKSSNSTHKIEAPVESSSKTISAWWLISIPVGIIVYLVVRALFGSGGSSIQFGFICGILTLWITNFIVKATRK